MSQSTPHIHRGLAVRFDELVEPMTVSMRHATWLFLDQLETGSEEVPKQRYQVKAKPKFIDGKLSEATFADDDSEVDSTYATKHEAEVRARELKDAGHHTAIVDPTEAAEAPLSYGRFRVHSQVNAHAPFVQTHTFDTDGEAQEQARKLEDDGLGTQIIDSNTGAVVPNVYPDGTAVANEATYATSPTDPNYVPGSDGVLGSAQFPVHPEIENQPPAGA
jgi:hypothetical protein